ncbi:hypothetical protein [Streptomyces sp. NPDC059209]|uniref:hypothetical protein n=1 Tax=Streptomyces sp. NPDC059209 TaxID=3346769 RepID=UPI00369C2454
MAKQIHMTTTDNPMTGRQVEDSWMIWGGEAGSFGAAMGALEAIAGSHGADAVIAVRVVAVSDTHTRMGFLSGESVESRVGYQAYGTAIRYV